MATPHNGCLDCIILSQYVSEILLTATAAHSVFDLNWDRNVWSNGPYRFSFVTDVVVRSLLGVSHMTRALEISRFGQLSTGG